MAGYSSREQLLLNDEDLLNWEDGEVHNPDVQPNDIYISKEEDRLLDGSLESPSLATSCHGSESEAQAEEAMDSIASVSSRRFTPVEERRGAGRGNSRGRFARRSHTLGQRNRKKTKQTYLKELLQHVANIEKNQEILLWEIKSWREITTNSQSVQAPCGD